MPSYCTPLFLSLFLLSQTAAAYTLAQDAIPANPNSRISAKYALLLLRQNIIYCSETYDTTYCVDSVCCGIYNCMPANAECCANGQYCLAGTTCEWVYGEMTCQCNNGGCSNSVPQTQTAATETVTATVAAPTSTTAPPAQTSTTAPPASSPSSSSNDSGGGQGLSSGTLAGIGSIAGIVSAIATVWMCIRCRRGRS